MEGLKKSDILHHP